MIVDMKDGQWSGEGLYSEDRKGYCWLHHCYLLPAPEEGHSFSSASGATTSSSQRECAILQKGWNRQVAVWGVLQCPRVCSRCISGRPSELPTTMMKWTGRAKHAMRVQIRAFCICAFRWDGHFRERKVEEDEGSEDCGEGGKVFASLSG
jgi:hypothetical protein